MASSIATESLSSRLKVIPYVFNPDTTDATDVGWINFRDYEKVLVVATHHIGTGDVTTFSLLSNSAADGTGTDATIKSHAVGTQPDAIGDYLILEASADEIKGNDADAKGFSATMTLGTATDEFNVVYILTPKRAYDGLTSDTIA